jgi:hypothetical protein
LVRFTAVSGGAQEASDGDFPDGRPESATSSRDPPAISGSPRAERAVVASPSDVFLVVRKWLGSTRAVSLAVGVLVGALQLERASSGTISPYDEGYHLSYVQYVGQGHLPHIGDPLNTWSREAFSCHPVFPFGDVTSVPCGEIAAPGEYPEGGTNTAAGWPPPYYAYAAVVTRFLALVGVEPLYGARTASALLWAAGAAALVLVARRFGGNLAAAASAGLVAGAIPAANTLGAFVTPHSAQLLLSVVIGATVLQLMRREAAVGRADVLAGVAVPPLAVMVVPHALVAVTIAYIALAAHWGHRALRGARLPWRAWAPAAAPLLAVAVHEAWQLFVDAQATAYGPGVDATQEQDLADPRGDSLVRPLIAQWWHFWPGGLSGDDLGFSSWELFVSTGAVMLAAGAVGVALLSANPSPLARALAIGLVVGGPLTAWVAERMFPFNVPGRYGASVIGIALLLVALTVARRPSRPLLVLSVVVWGGAAFAQWP